MNRVYLFILLFRCVFFLLLLFINKYSHVVACKFVRLFLLKDFVNVSFFFFAPLSLPRSFCATRSQRRPTSTLLFCSRSVLLLLDIFFVFNSPPTALIAGCARCGAKAMKTVWIGASGCVRRASCVPSTYGALLRSFRFSIQVIFFPETHVIARHHRNDNIYSNNYLLLANALFPSASCDVYISFLFRSFIRLCELQTARDRIRFQFFVSTAIDCVLHLARAAFSLSRRQPSSPHRRLCRTRNPAPMPTIGGIQWEGNIDRTNALHVAIVMRIDSIHVSMETRYKQPQLCFYLMLMYTHRDDENKNFTIRSFAFFVFFLKLSRQSYLGLYLTFDQ